MPKSITRIVLTGGPAAGKTTLISRILTQGPGTDEEFRRLYGDGEGESGEFARRRREQERKLLEELAQPVVGEHPHEGHQAGGKEGHHHPAGDVAALAVGNNLEAALQWAPINSMNVVQHPGSQAGLLTVSELEKWLAKAPDWYHATDF